MAEAMGCRGGDGFRSGGVEHALLDSWLPNGSHTLDSPLRPLTSPVAAGARHSP